ncbi:MAG: hypothetical protein Aurels2KO_16120 [Aureliella sp.]
MAPGNFTISELASYVSKPLLSWGVSALIGSFMVLLVSIVLWRICENRFSPRLGFWLFFLVMIKPLVPISYSLPDYLAVWIPGEIAQRVLVVGDLAPQTGTEMLEQAASLNTTDLVYSTVQPPPAAEGQSLAAADERVESRRDQVKHVDSVPAALHVGSGLETSISAWDWRNVLGAIYVMAVVMLASQFFLQQLKYGRKIRNARTIPADELNVDVSELCRVAYQSRVIRVVELAGISSPAIWGARKPTLVLPAQLWRTLSADQLKWIALHELAHVYRRDGVIQFFQRLLLILQFWNPFVWVAYYFANRCREDDCDDLALHWSERNAVSAGEAFMSVVRYAKNQYLRIPNNSPAAVALFSGSSRKSCIRRMKRLLDADRQLHVRNGLKVYLTLIVACILLLPGVRTVALAQDTLSASSALGDSGLAASTFEIQIVDADGQAIPHADVEIRSNPKRKWNVISGTFQREGAYGQFTRADENGVIAVELPEEKLKTVSFSIFAAGFAPYWASWSKLERVESLPSRFTVTLDAGKSVGGVIVDEEGNFIEKAQIHPNVEYKKRADDNRQLSVGKKYMTDAKGRWRVDTIPADKPSVYVTVTHPDFMPTSTKLDMSQFQLVGKEVASKVIRLSRGLTLAGIVSDENGNPISGAIVRTRLRNEILESTTDAQGEYRLPRCAEGSTAVAVTANGFGPEVQDVNVQPGLSPVNFVLPPGQHIRVRVTDADGKAVARTRMFFQRWRDRRNFADQLGMMFEYTDENGIWECNSAPDDALVFDICPPGSMQIVNQSLVARDEEYHFVASPLLTIDGAVVDEKSRQPISSFRVTPGDRWVGRDEPFWHDREAFEGTNGSFEAVFGRVDGTKVLTINASGYAPLTSRDIHWDEGRLEMEFALKKAPDIIARVLQPGGLPAAAAEAALGVGDTQIVISDGKFSTSTFSKRVISDDAGQLNLGAQTEPLGLVIVHATGYAETVIDPTETTIKPITLVAWGKVEGHLHVAEAIGARREIVLNYNQREGLGSLARVRHENRVTTTATGEFRFEHVLPVSASIGINVKTHVTRSGHTSAQSHRRVIAIEPGQMTRIELGGTGHSVKGKLLAPVDTKEVVDWEFSRITIKNAIGISPPIPYPDELKTQGERSDWFQKWRLTPAATLWRARASAYSERRNSQIRYMCGVENDGTFRIDDLPSGAYTFDFELDFPGKSWGPNLGTLEFHFSIDADDGQRTTVDLGELQVQNAN